MNTQEQVVCGGADLKGGIIFPFLKAFCNCYLGFQRGGLLTYKPNPSTIFYGFGLGF